MSGRIRRFRGFKALVHDAVDGVVDLVEEGHESTARAFVRAAEPIPPVAQAMSLVERVRRLSTRAVLGSVKMVNRAVQAASDAGLDAALPTGPGRARVFAGEETSEP